MLNFEENAIAATKSKASLSAIWKPLKNTSEVYTAWANAERPHTTSLSAEACRRITLAIVMLLAADARDCAGQTPSDNSATMPKRDLEPCWSEDLNYFYELIDLAGQLARYPR